MPGKSDYNEQNFLNHLLRGVAMPVPLSFVYLALFETTPADDGTGGVECSYSGYVRCVMPCDTATWKDPATATQGQSRNNAPISWPPNGGPSDVTINGLGVYDAASGGNLLYADSISSFTLARMQQLQVPTFGLVVSES